MEFLSSVLDMNIFLTKHAKEQMKERGISEDDVINAVKYPEKIQKIDNVYYAKKKIMQGTIKVVYIRENYIKVITVYPI